MSEARPHDTPVDSGGGWAARLGVALSLLLALAALGAFFVWQAPRGGARASGHLAAANVANVATPAPVAAASPSAAGGGAQGITYYLVDSPAQALEAQSGLDFENAERAKAHEPPVSAQFVNVNSLEGQRELLLLGSQEAERRDSGDAPPIAVVDLRRLLMSP